jgi:hypothetical protein
MTRSLTKLSPGDLIEWGERFRVAGLPTLLRATDNFTIDRRSRLDVPD